ncbi:hypothetical protein DKT75_13485 [Leucothrix arctica]|uniref:Uncharacterized protein n=2 Tax=Leucothrix arctica TaxID=1481894 RepID=A0A317C9U1_9GAMM|nr:hypothetical protein DKT75_13485 [Leucothrix arctica]
MVASAIKHHSIHQVRNWTQAELLKHVLDREEKRWQATLSQYSENEKASIYKLLTIATLSGGLDLEHDENHVYDALNETDIANSESELERYIEVIKQLSGNPSGSLQPDIFAEYFLLQDSQYRTGGFTRSLKRSLVTAQELSPQDTHAFISRAAVDYTSELTAFKWWKLLFTKANTEESNELLEELTASAFNTISQLSLHGERHTILDHWLPTLCALEDLKSKARAINYQGLLNSHLGNKTIALEHYQTADEIYKKLGEKSGESSTLNNISQIFKARGDYETTLKYLQQSLAIQQEIGDKSGEGTTLNNMATTAHARGDYEIALKYLQQSMAIKQATGDKSGEGVTLNNISQIFKARGDFETAIKYLQHSLTIRQEIGDRSGEGTTLNNMATIAQARGDYETALKYLQQSLVIQQEIGDKSGESITLNNISLACSARDDYKTALKYLQQSLAIQQEIGDKYGKGATLNNISQIYRVRGNYETALKYLQQSLAIQQEIGDAAGLCVTTINIGHIQWENSQQKEAYKSWAEAYQIAKKIEHAQSLEALTGLAEQLDLPNGLEGWEMYLND